MKSVQTFSIQEEQIHFKGTSSQWDWVLRVRWGSQSLERGPGGGTQAQSPHRGWEAHLHLLRGPRKWRREEMAGERNEGILGSSEVWIFT